MRKVWVVAATEFGARVRSKAFIVSVVLMPVLVIVMALVQRALEGGVDPRPRRFAVLDGTGALYDVLARAAAARREGVRFEPVAESVNGSIEETRLALSDRVRRDQLFAFVEIPREILGSDGKAAIAYHSDSPTYDALPKWIQATLHQEIRLRRYGSAGIDPVVVERLERPVVVGSLGLLTRGPDGRVVEAERVDPVRTWAAPIGLAMLLFILTMMSAPQLMQAVIEEKLSRVSEVLLGSVPPFELMMGKLLGGAAVSLLLALVYAAGGIFGAAHLGYASLFGTAVLVWSLVFLLLAVLLYGSLYLAVGAACNEIKDAQNLVMPVMLLSFIPVVMLSAVAEAPASRMAVVLSLFPPATPFLMPLRLALHPSAPAWQAGLSALLTFAAAMACVWAAGRIFRVGLLAHGRTPSFLEMLRWIRTG